MYLHLFILLWILNYKSKNDEKHFYKNKTKFCCFMYSNFMERYSGVVKHSKLRKKFFKILFTFFYEGSRRDNWNNITKTRI